MQKQGLTICPIWNEVVIAEMSGAGLRAGNLSCFLEWQPPRSKLFLDWCRTVFLGFGQIGGATIAGKWRDNHVMDRDLKFIMSFESV
jgi:hypothetical protein